MVISSGDCGITDNLAMPTSPSSPESALHLLVPFAAASDPACQERMTGLALPNLGSLLALLQAGETLAGDDYSFSTPHERALARAIGLEGEDGRLPWAALAHPDIPGPQAWFHLCHFQVGMDQVQLVPANQLDIQPDESAALMQAIEPLCREDGLTLTMDTPGRWHAQGPALAGLRCASLDRVAGRSVDGWMATSPTDPQAERWLRRLQNEAQMLFYTHPVNDAREARRALTLNGFWADGAGSLSPGVMHKAAPEVADHLRQPALSADWSSWSQAWTALDAGPMARLLDAARSGHPVTLTLCGERHARTWHGPVAGLGGLWRRLRGPSPVAPILQSL